MILWLLVLIVLVYVLYAPLPELLFKLLHVGTVWRGPATLRKVALTFDDGPDPRYTPQVLDILREHDVKATFFLVGQRAEAHPELVEQILADGHQVASHGDAHRHAWLMGRIATARDIRDAKIRLERLTGQKITYYRPPWGAFNMYTRIECLALGLKPTLWSRRAIDWLPGHYADEVIQRVVGGAHTGAIYLCHDAGGAEGAPLNTIEALPVIIERLSNQGYGFATVAEMDGALADHKRTMKTLFGHYPWARRLLIRIWSLVELAFTNIYHIESINRIFRVSKTAWNHGNRVDEDGRIILTNGAKAIDLHFQNETMITLSSGNDNRALIRGLRMAREGFRDLARLLQTDPKYQDVEVTMAMTLMNRGLEMLGFHVEDLPETKQKKRLQLYMRFLMGMYHPEGFRRLKQGRQSLGLKLVWITRDEIIKLYG